MDNITKNVVIPVDGSRNSLKSLDYLNLMYGAEHKLQVSLLYILPALPPILTDPKTMDKRIRAKLKVVEKKNVQMAERILSEARAVLIKRGFDEKDIRVLYKKLEKSTARDIFNWANKKQVDAVLLTRRGQTNLETFFMGGTSSNLVNYCRDCPVWILGGSIRSKKVLLCVDNSDNVLRAVDHAGFMLSGTDCRVTIFHTMRHLSRFVPLEVIEDASELQELWKTKAGQEIAAYLEKAKKMLLNAGLNESQIDTKVIEGHRSAAEDILKEARGKGYGTIIAGRRGISGVKEFFMGSVTSKILHNSTGLAIWIV